MGRFDNAKDNGIEATVVEKMQWVVKMGQKAEVLQLWDI